MMMMLMMMKSISREQCSEKPDAVELHGFRKQTKHKCINAGDAAIADFKTEDVGKHVYLEARDAYNIMAAAVVD